MEQYDALFDEESSPHSALEFPETRVEEESFDRIPVVTLPNSKPASFKPQTETILASFPKYINIRSKAYNPETIQLEDVVSFVGELEEVTTTRLQGTIMWRKETDEHGNIKRISNAHFVEWDDGHLSIVIGKEIFDISSQPFSDNNSYIYVPRSQEQLIEDQGLCSTKYTLRFADISNAKKWTSIGEAKIKLAATIEDPELARRELEKSMLEESKKKQKNDIKERARKEREYAKMSSSGFTQAFLEDMEPRKLSRDTRKSAVYEEEEFSDDEDFIQDDEDESMEDSSESEENEPQKETRRARVSIRKGRGVIESDED